MKVQALVNVQPGEYVIETRDGWRKVVRVTARTVDGEPNGQYDVYYLEPIDGGADIIGAVEQHLTYWDYEDVPAAPLLPDVPAERRGQRDERTRGSPGRARFA